MESSKLTGNCILITFIFSFCLLVADASMQNKMHQQHSSRVVSPNQATIALSIDQEKGNANQLQPAVDAIDQEFLAAHNKVRLHQGEQPFIWDSKLAVYARQYAEKRKIDCDLVHSNGPFGENIFWGGGNQWQAANVVGLWVREHRYYDRATMKCVEGKMCGHYTQIVWRDSVRLGCARVQCMSGDTFAICSYDPPGNYIGDNPFSSNN